MKKSAIELVTEERISQVTKKGYTAEHDDTYPSDSLACLGAYYAMPQYAKEETEFHTYSEGMELKDYSDRKTELIKAAALIIAEIDVLIRKEERNGL